MTNTELIRQEIERRIGAMYNFSSGYSALNVCRELLDFIDSLPKETVTGCHQLEEAAEGTIDSVSYEGIGDRTLIAVAMTHEELRKLGEYHIDSVVHIRKAN